MSTSIENKTLNTEILKRLDEHGIMLTGLSLTMQLFIQKQDGINCGINEKLDKVTDDMYGNGKKGIKAMIERLWEDFQAWQNSRNTVVVAVITMVIVTVINMVWK